MLSQYLDLVVALLLQNLVLYLVLVELQLVQVLVPHSDLVEQKHLLQLNTYLDPACLVIHHYLQHLKQRSDLVIDPIHLK